MTAANLASSSPLSIIVVSIGTTAVASTDVEVWVIRRTDFEELLGSCPHLQRAMSRFYHLDALSRYLQRRQELDPARVRACVDEAGNLLKSGRLVPPASEVERAGEGAPLAIWLGVLLDGIPESLVIGVTALRGFVGYSLVGGLFLSNFPEALSSSVGMREQGMSFWRVFWMWFSLMIITGAGAALGSLAFAGAPTGFFSVLEGMAAGAMLTMIAETMLPEAYAKGPGVTGISTLLGFLAAIFLKTLAPGVH